MPKSTSSCPTRRQGKQSHNLVLLLLLLAHFGKEAIPQAVVPKISQETLAEMVGATRSRVSFFMNRFRELGFIRYNGGCKSTAHFLTSFCTIRLGTIRRQIG